MTKENTHLHGWAKYDHEVIWSFPKSYAIRFFPVPLEYFGNMDNETLMPFMQMLK